MAEEDIDSDEFFFNLSAVTILISEFVKFHGVVIKTCHFNQVKSIHYLSFHKFVLNFLSDLIILCRS